MKKFTITLFLITPILLSVISYSQLPATMAIHWDITGNVNGYASKPIALFLLPFISILLYGLFLFLPSTDPYKKNFSQFQKYYEDFIIVVLGFLFYIHLLSITWNLGHHINMIQLLSPAFSLLFYFIGILTSVAKRNWFVGIRTPWTLSSEKVWNVTHQVGSKLFKAVALIALLGLIFPYYTFYILLMPLLAVTVFVYVFSYLKYRQYEK